MAVNKGVVPVDPTTLIGRFRVLLGDTSYVELDPVEPGYGNYAMYSDIEIEGFLAQSEDLVEGGLYFAYMQMAGAAARESRNVKDLDLQVDLTKRATDLRLIAQGWKDQWNSQTADIFEVFDVGDSNCGCVPELAPRVVCRRGCSGRQLF